MAGNVLLGLGFSFAAVLVSLFTLWNTHLRKGKLHVAAPKQWAGGVWKDGTILAFPLAVCNSGARAVVVTDLRLLIMGQEGNVPFRWERTRQALDSGTDSTMAAPFFVDPKSSLVKFVEFHRPSALAHKAQTYDMALEAQTANRGTHWQRLLVFSWGLSDDDLTNIGRMIPRRNAATEAQPPI